MTVEREIAGFSLPFAAGTAFIFLAGISDNDMLTANAAVSVTAVSACLIPLMHGSWKKHGTWFSWGMICTLTFCLGCFCGACGKILEISVTESIISSHACKLGARMQEFADAVPFESRSTNALIKALLTGERSDIPRDVTASFRESGASHILALSGLHLGIIYGIVRSLTSLSGNGKHVGTIRSIIIVSVCLIYTLATGAGASIVRAMIFIIINEAARMAHRYHSTGSVLLASLVVQLTISPSSINSVGFQLSYAAMAGIAFIFPWLKALWPGSPFDDRGFTKGMRWIWNSASMSIACQITTAPLAWYHFNSFPIHFLLTNLIALPLTGLIIPLSLATVTLNAFGICPALLIKATEFSITSLTNALEVIAAM